MLVSQLISNAFFLSGILARQFETLDGTQSYDGLRFLNTILAEKNIDSNGIFYTTHKIFSATIGDEEYFIPNLIKLNTLTFNLNQIRFPMKRITPNRYFGDARVNGVTSIPSIFYDERAKGGTNIFIYYSPDQNYTFTISGKFSNPSSFKLDDDIDVDLETFYTSYLEYAIAERTCNFYGVPFNPQAKALLNKKEQGIEVAPGDDFTMRTPGANSAGKAFGQIYTNTSHNLSTGFYP